MQGFNRKLVGGIAFILLLFLPILGGSLYSLWRVVSDQDELIAVYTEELFLARDLRRHEIQQDASMPVFILTGDPKVLKEFKQSNEGFDATLTQLEAKVRDPESKYMLSGIRNVHSELYSLSMPGIALKRNGETVEKVNAYFREKTGGKSLELASKLGDFLKKTTDAYESEKEDNVRNSSRLIKILAFASGLAFLLCAVVAGLLINLVRQKRNYDETNELLVKRERQLSKARKETLEVVAHDLKNPLSSIILSSQAALLKLEKGPAEGQAITRGLEVTLKSASSMKRLIDDLLDHAKVESGSFILQKEECEIEPLIRSLVTRFEPIASGKHIGLHCRFEGNLPLVSLDEIRFEQVLSNLIGNALKFTPDSGSVHVMAAVNNGHVFFSVSDTGPGMSKEQAAHVFERYWQVRETASQGTGLGLAISKAIVQAHGGKIWVESEPGRGAAFYFSLPYKKIANLASGAIPSEFSDSVRNPAQAPPA